MADADDDDLSFVHDPQAGVLRVSGGLLTEADADAMRERLVEAGQTGRDTLVADLSAVTFLPSLAVRALVQARNAVRARGVRLDVHALPGTLPHRVLTISGFTVATDPPGA